ncbi:class I SAM-dependent methyltransferase [Effusibacillus lacus]|uniref:Methylase n=1 Tax=Effusibacillus lacus TaxID=1348429 RepID=A0A292YQK2_9BACL|nr:methyltransferase domain-containing protein [Effusibacillus lacus]TCS76856.1 ubiquinone/menaquinone biosynthesis C-methylase UbiE [Effusibacillus lacus]GAX91189.1 methylase [Effusibacillus lacus]
MDEEQQIKQKVNEQFSKNAEKYVTSDSHAKGGDLSLLVEWLQPEPHWIALDIATGGGHVAKTLSPHVAHVFSTDLTKQMLANTARHLNQSCKNIWYVLADAESLPFLDHTFDIVTCRIAPHHFPNPRKFVSEVERVLKPHGKFLLIDNVVPDKPELAEFMNTLEKLRDESHVRCLSVKEWKDLFNLSNLIEIKSLIRKKTFQFPGWVERTAGSREQIDRVKQYICDASEEIHQYFSVVIENEEIQSLQVDEWMVLSERP